MKPKVDLIYIDSGGGHRAAALALDEVIRGMELSWDLRLVSIQDLFAPIDVVRKVSGIPFQDLYNIMLRRGWTAGSAQMTPLAHLAIRVFHPSQLRVLSNYWAERRPDLVVSLIPHFNRAIKQSLESTLPQTRLVTILTDIADYPPHFWLERQDQFVICGCEHAQQQALSIGVPAEKVFCASGMILHPRFYEPIALDRPSERSRLGLDPNLPTALVLFGGEGSPEMIDVARELNRPGAGLQLILLCGRQDRVKQELSAQTRHVPMFIEGFTRQVPYFMELADFFIGKPGPGSISEAIVKRLPIVVRQDWRTLAHERYNCEWIREQEAGLVVGSYSDLPDAVRQLLSPERYGRIRQRLAAMDNRAVFEIPAMLERVLTWPDNLQAQTPATARQRHLSPKSRRRSYLNAT